MEIIIFILRLFSLAISTHWAKAQVGGLCACNPATITFELKFDQNCQTNTIQAGGLGVENVGCALANAETSGGDPDNTNFVPQLVSEVQIEELDQSISRIAASVYSQTFVEGNRITYTSNVANFTDLTAGQITKGLQMTLRGLSGRGNGCDLPDGCEIINTWGILFTNVCGEFPIFELQDQMGWIEIVDFTFPINQYCPGNPTLSPTATPNIPSLRPTIAPSTARPTEALPTWVPSTKPSILPSAAPSQQPTQSMMPSLTSIPSFSSSQGTCTDCNSCGIQLLCPTFKNCFWNNDEQLCSTEICNYCDGCELRSFCSAFPDCYWDPERITCRNFGCTTCDGCVLQGSCGAFSGCEWDADKGSCRSRQVSSGSNRRLTLSFVAACSLAIFYASILCLL